MAPKTKEVGIRLSVKDKEVVERALKSIGGEGEAALKRIERAGKPASTSLHALNAAAMGLRTSMTGIVTGAVAGLLPVLSLASAFGQAKQAMQEFGDIADKSKSAGVDPEYFQGLAHQAKLAGVEIDELSVALDTYNRNSGQAIEGRGRMVTALKAENAELLESIRNARSQEERVRLIADAIDRAGSSAEKAALATAVFGGSGAKMVAVFEGGADAIDTTMRKARDLGIIIDRETIAKADELGDKFDTVTKILDTQFKTAIIALAPFLVNFSENVANIVRGLGDFIGRFRDIKELSRGALEKRLVSLGAEDLDMENALIGYRGRVGRDPSVQYVVDDLERKRANNQAEQRAILAQLATLGDGPEITVRGGNGGDDGGELPPLADPEARAALKEAEALMKRLRTASEEYAATVADITSKRDAGLIGQETFNRALAEAAVTFADAADTSEEYAQALARLDDAKERGIITERQYTSAVEDLTKRRLTAQNDWLAGLELGLLQIKQSTDDVSGAVAGTLSSWADSLGQQIGDMVRKGKFEWRDLVNSMLADIARLTTQQMIVRPIANILSTLLGSAFGGGSFIGGSPGAPPLQPGYQVGVAHSGGVIGLDMLGTRNVAADMILSAPRLHLGLAPDEFPAILQRGEEVIPRGGRRSQPTVNVTLAPTFQINGSGLSPEQLQMVLEENNRSLLDAVPGVVQQAIRNGAFG